MVRYPAALILCSWLCFVDLHGFQVSRNSGVRRIFKIFPLNSQHDNHDMEEKVHAHISRNEEELSGLDVKGAKAWVEEHMRSGDVSIPAPPTSSSASSANATLFSMLLSEKIRSIVQPELLDLQKSTNALFADMRAELAALSERSANLLQSVKAELSSEESEEGKELESRLETLSSALENLEWLSRRSFAAGDQAVVEVESFRQTLGEFEKELSGLKLISESILKKVEGYEEQLPALRDELLSKLNEVASSAASLEEVETLKLRILDGIARTETKTEEVQNYIAESTNKGAAMSNQLTSLQSEVTNLKAELSSQKQKISSNAEQAATKVELLSSDLKQETGDLRRAVESLTMDLDEGMERTDQRTKSAIGELRKRVQGMLSDFRKDFDALRGQVGEVNQMVSQKETAILRELQTSTTKLRSDVDGQIKKEAQSNAQKFLLVESKIDKEIARQGEVVAESIAQVMRALQAENNRNKKELLTQMSALERAVTRIEDGMDARIEAALKQRSLRVQLARMIAVAKRRCLRWFENAKNWALRLRRRVTRPSMP